MEPCEMTAAEAATLIGEGKLTSEALVRSCLERIADRDPLIRAWLYVDPQHAIRQARELDKRPSMGPLHGVPFGIKDIMDTVDMPTTHNSPLYLEHRPGKDAACVAVARHSGSVILGKTDTVEFAAAGRMAATRNPNNPEHTPGGSSAGSGAAVADFHVPLAFGTQTGGSHVRPASYNGIYGVKPTWGIVSNEGTKQHSSMLDTVGWFGRSADDLVLVARAFQIPDLDDVTLPDVRGLRVAVCRSPYWSASEEGGIRALEEAEARLRKAGALVTDLDLPAPFASLDRDLRVILAAESRATFLPEHLGRSPHLHQDFHDKVANKQRITREALREAYDVSADCRRAFDALFADIDVVLTPAVRGEAPKGIHATGDMIFCTSWTVLHAPCVAIPAIIGRDNLPVGIQIVGPRFADARLLRIAQAIAPIIDVEPRTVATGMGV